MRRTSEEERTTEAAARVEARATLLISRASTVFLICGMTKKTRIPINEKSTPNVRSPTTHCILRRVLRVGGGHAAHSSRLRRYARAAAVVPPTRPRRATAARLSGRMASHRLGLRAHLR